MTAKAKDIFKLSFKKREETKESFENDIKIKTIVYLILALVAVALTVLNIVKKYWFMTGTTTGLFVICILCFLLVKFKKNRDIPEILLGLCIGFIFTYYAFTGQNYGFAILWILLVPGVGMLLLSFSKGLILSIYFLLLLIVLFYTPLKDLPWIVNLRNAGIKGCCDYTDTFKMRFPLLYFAAFVSSFVLSGQKVYYLNKSNDYALLDAMTGLRNRRYFNELFNEYPIGKEIPLDLTIISLDLNSLKYINDSLGHESGDKAICCVATNLEKVFKPVTNLIYRTGGDEFVIVFVDTNNEVGTLLQEFDKNLCCCSVDSIKITASYGYVKGRDYVNGDFRYLIAIAESNMYASKEKFYKENGTSRSYGKKETLYDGF